MPPDVAARQAGRTVSAPPPPDSWLVAALLPPAPQGSEAAGSPSAGGPRVLYVDVGRKGEVLTAEAVTARFPSLAAQATGGGGEQTALPPLIREPQLWADMCRMMMSGHMRRGESDLVAHWMLQVMALDPLAPEWRHVLSSGLGR